MLASARLVAALHPVTGALAYSGQQCREGALMAIDDINRAGGIKSLGGAKIEPLLGDAQSTPAAGTAEIEKMNEAGVCSVVGAYASAICLARSTARSTGRPARSAERRAPLSPCDASGIAQPQATSSTIAGSTPARSSASFITSAESSTG